MCHDYKAPGRDAWAGRPPWRNSAGVNVHVGRVGEDEFVAMRAARDGLPAPALLLPSIQVNIRAGLPRRPGGYAT